MTIAALMIGRSGSTGLPGKNTMPVLGRPLMTYPLIAANDSAHVDVTYISSDSEEMIEIASELGALPILRPAVLCTKEALGEDAFRHGYDVIKSSLENEMQDLEFIVLLMANAATITSELIDQGIAMLRSDPNMDSAVTVSTYNMWSPIRARSQDSSGYLKPFVPFDAYENPEQMSCDRDSQGDIFFADMGASIVRPRCIDNMENGLMPQKWMGQNIGAIRNWGGCDIDYHWQVSGVEYWLRQHGFS